MEHSDDLLMQLYSTMLRIRLFEESIVEPILNADIRTPCHLYTGEEAIACGMCAALMDEDYVFGTHRSHGHFIAKGGSVLELLAEIYCRETGCSRGRGGSMHLIDPEKGFMGAAPIVAGTISLAVGTALASSIRKDGRVTIAFFGDGAVGEGVLYESMNFASLKKLPVIFACENNFYATHMPIRECRTDHKIYRLADQSNMLSFRLDGNDVLSVFEKSTEAVMHCRQGNGPVFMEFLTYRHRGHVGPDDNVLGTHTDIRTKEEVDRWLERDPITLFEAYLLEKNIFTRDVLDKIHGIIKKEIKEVHRAARKGPIPKEEELLNYVFE